MEVVELLQKMVSFDTVNTALSGKQTPEAPLAAYLCEVAQASGFDARYLSVRNQADELLIRYERDPSLPWILFDSHLDTVSIEGMTIDPFEGANWDGRIWGRGSADTKGSGAAMLAALQRYAMDAKTPGSGKARASGADTAAEATRTAGAAGASRATETARGCNVLLLYSVDEEHGMSGIRAFAGKHYQSLGVHVEGAIVGEPTRLEAVIAHNGVLRFTFVTNGIAAHSADPSLGRSAISSMMRLISFIESTYIPSITTENELTGKAQCSINVIRGGTAVNIIPEYCEAQMDRRIVPGESPRSVAAELESYITEFKKQNPDDDVVELKTDIETPPLTPIDGAPFIKNILTALKSSGQSDTPVGVRYATHAGDLSNAGIPSIVLGPGDIAQGHTKNEWIDIEQLETAADVYYTIMRDFEA